MRDLDEFTVTDEALSQMAGTPNARLKEITEAAVRHLHAFAREVNLTPEEWLNGIQFLTAVGKMCSPLRQEFILLSDVLGLSAVVNALHDKKARELGSQSSLLGPFYREGAPELPLGAQIVEKPTEPEIVVYGKVTDNTGTPIRNALVQV
ncbi:MAG TPA: dioxygenase, partial [Rhodopila sp.]|nr:dioxygenase [Rhodopila sp.]